MPPFQLNTIQARPQAPATTPAFNRWTFPDGREWALFYHQGDDYLLRFPGLADFEISADGKEITAWRDPAAPEAAAHNLYMNQAVPLALSRQGRLVVHASAVDIDGVCIAFAGVSGRGKSTLAASFALAGHPFLTDDGLQLLVSENGVTVQPAHASLRLWEDSRLALLGPNARAAPPIESPNKVRFPASADLPYCDQPRPLHAIFYLGTGESTEIHVTPLRPQAAVLEILQHSFLLDVHEHDLLSSHFNEITDVASRCRHMRLDFPREFGRLAGVRRALQDIVRGDERVRRT